jgi:hypothetical protein
MLPPELQIGGCSYHHKNKMKKDFKIRIRMMAFLAVFVLLSSFSVLAFSITVPGSLSLYPGQTFEGFIDVQNVGSSQAVTVEGSFTVGSEVIDFSGENTLTIPPNGIGSFAVVYEIPANAPLGTEYTVNILVKTISAGEGDGTVDFVQDAERSYVVTVVEEEQAIPPEQPAPEGGSGMWMWIIVVVVIVIVVFIVMKRKGHPEDTVSTSAPSAV